MMKHVCLILCFIFSINGQTIIRGDEFKSFSDFIVEPGTRFNPKDVFAGSIVFVKTNCLNSFFIKDYPKIDHPFILVSHESDKPSPGKYKKYLNDQKFLAWFGQNPSIINHKKFFLFQLGLQMKNGFMEIQKLLQKSNQPILIKHNSCTSILT